MVPSLNLQSVPKSSSGDNIVKYIGDTETFDGISSNVDDIVMDYKEMHTDVATDSTKGVENFNIVTTGTHFISFHRFKLPVQFNSDVKLVGWKITIAKLIYIFSGKRSFG